jgi:hypothetical protein
VFTVAAEAHIPTVTELPLPGSASCSWTVTGYGPQTDVNAAAAQNLLEIANQTDYTGPAHGSTSIPTRAFTTP